MERQGGKKEEEAEEGGGEEASSSWSQVVTQMEDVISINVSREHHPKNAVT